MTKRRFTKSDPWLYGFEAFHAGYAEANNPFEYPSEGFDGWQRGWLAACELTRKECTT